MITVSDAMIADLWCEEPQPKAILVTISGGGLGEDVRVTNYAGVDPDNRTVEGLTSRSNFFQFAPFEFAFGGSGKGEAARDATLTIQTFDGQIDLAIDTATGRPSITVEMVRIADPDFVELAITNAAIAVAETDGPKATATIRPRDFSTEPACAARMTPARTPCLF